MAEATRILLAIEEIKGDIKVIKSGQLDLRTDLTRIECDVKTKHEENRKSIHNLRDWCQVLVDKIHLVEVKNAAWAAGTGASVAIIVKLIDHWWH